VVRGGVMLDPAIQALCKLDTWLGDEDLDRLTVDRVRASLRRNAAVVGGGRRAVAELREADAGGVPARLYVAPEAPPQAPLVVYYHGGGHVAGDLDTHDPICRFLAREAAVRVLAVDYRLAPEHPFPAAVEDALTAFRFAAAHAAELGADPARLAVAGDSAGGNLAAAVAQATAGDEIAPAFQLLIYPVLDSTRERASYELFADGFLLSTPKIRWYRALYLPDPEAASDPRASPLLREDLSGLAPAHITTAGFDPLRDEAEEYAAGLRAAGVPTTLRRYAGFAHGHASMVGLGERLLGPPREIAAALRWALAGRP
jgi:acetyl esterase